VGAKWSQAVTWRPKKQKGKEADNDLLLQQGTKVGGGSESIETHLGGCLRFAAAPCFGHVPMLLTLLGVKTDARLGCALLRLYSAASLVQGQLSHAAPRIGSSTSSSSCSTECSLVS